MRELYYPDHELYIERYRVVLLLPPPSPQRPFREQDIGPEQDG